MLYQNIEEKEIKIEESVENMKISDNEIYYDKNNVIKCPKCNNLIFYIENYYIHKCPIANKSYEIYKGEITNKSNKLICNINNIDFKCVKHQKDFLYLKDSNYYCSECIKENNLEDYLNLDFITLTKNEIKDFNKIIIDSENILKEINVLNENYIKKIKESCEIFMNRNKSLIEFCKNLLKFNEKYEKNYNLISTIRRI